MRCEEARQQILEHTLEEGLPAAGPLQAHLRRCAACSYFQVRVAETDQALRALPVESAPAETMRRVLAQAAAPGGGEVFLPWSLWLPVVSMLVGLIWAYVTLIWQRGPAMAGSLDPLGQWFTHVEQWLLTQQSTLLAVGLSVAAGLFFTLLAIGLGLYIGRQRVATSH